MSLWADDVLGLNQGFWTDLYHHAMTKAVPRLPSDWLFSLRLDKSGLLWWNEIGWQPVLPEYTPLLPKAP
jgi:hypothetical protein